MFPFQGLDASQLIVTDNPLPMLSQLGSPLIELIEFGGVHLIVLIPIGGQPVTAQVRFEIGLFLRRRPAWRAEICSTRPRLMISSAISRPVQWLMGRSEPSGFSQARASI